MPMPGPYIEYDPVKKEKLLKKLQKQQEDASRQAGKKRGSSTHTKVSKELNNSELEDET